ncbi:substrate-binding domain-containing protein [Hansschlegelia sp.]|uniref:substrate-binding domain-containing protein n=1 Tax=Hansschlegelia sp. TaxID=2041892 RepID=UPI0039C8AABB
MLAALVVAAWAGGPAVARELRVCADPNNLPFSDKAGEGYENKLVELVARDLDAKVTYVWWAQRRGFLRNTILAGKCDLVPGLPVGVEMLRSTAPALYRSSYVFVTRPDEPPISSLDDPRLRELKIGVQMIGDDGYNTPPAHALARRGVIDNVRGYGVFGDYSEPHPPSRVVDAVARGEVDVALVWGPLAGYFAARATPPLRVTKISPPFDGPRLPMAFDISMAVRRDDVELRGEVAAALRRHRAEVDAILAEYDIPRLDQPSQAAAER